jgi:flagellum-specific peptidoglycan hydrolase FlgJ
MLNIQSITPASFGKWCRKTLTLLLLLVSQLVFAQSKYIKKYKPLADSLSEEYKIPTAVILGVAIIESGAGTSRNSKLLHNHFGIVGKNDLLKTNGIKSRYKQYKSAADSYLAFCKLLKKRKYYDKLKGNKNYHLWLDAMSKHGYSEDPEGWKQKITACIRKSKLSGTF